MVNQSRLEEIQKRLDGISAPKWEIMPNVHGDPAVTEFGRGGFGKIGDLSTHPSDYGRGNMEFIANSPDDIRYLLSIIAELTKNNAEEPEKTNDNDD